MKIEIKKILWPSIISSLVLLVLGLLLFFKSSATLVSISYTIGAVLFALGIIAIVRFLRNNKMDVFNQLNIVYGIICILSGVFFIKEPEFIASVMPVVLGIVIIISSSLKIQQSFVLRNMKSKYFMGSFITALLSLICGVILLFNPFASAVLLTKVIGIFLILYAVFDIINTIFVKKSMTIQMDIDNGTVHKKSSIKEAKVTKEVKRSKEEDK